VRNQNKGHPIRVAFLILNLLIYFFAARTFAHLALAQQKSLPCPPQLVFLRTFFSVLTAATGVALPPLTFEPAQFLGSRSWLWCAGLIFLFTGLASSGARAGM